jgi:hypothetical protein
LPLFTNCLEEVFSETELPVYGVLGNSEGTICYLLLGIEGPIPSVIKLAKRVVLGPPFLGTLKNALCPQGE